MTQRIAQDGRAGTAWFQRRAFLQGAVAWSALGGAAAARSQQRSNIVQLRGEVLLNGERLTASGAIQTGDTVQAGPGSYAVFVIGDCAFHVRQNSRVVVERGPALNTVGALRLITGAVACVWGRGARRHIITPTLTAGIRGTGVFAEVFAQQGNRSYFCNCYGAVDLAAGSERVASHTEYHESFWGEPEARNGRFLVPARLFNHSDEELESLARLVNQRTAWQISGRKGRADGDR